MQGQADKKVCLFFYVKDTILPLNKVVHVNAISFSKTFHKIRILGINLLAYI